MPTHNLIILGLLYKIAVAKTILGSGGFRMSKRRAG